ncbi:MAG: NUDIX hydrolase [Bacteroidota bacterium]
MNSQQDKPSSNWERLATEKGPSLRLFDIRIDQMRNRKTGKGGKMTILESNDSVNVLALTEDRHILVVRQYRFGIGYDTLELPGGMVDDGEDSLQAAKRELREETGYTGTSWEYLGSVPSNPVFMDSRIHHWLLRTAKRTHELALDDGEDIEVLRFPLDQVPDMLQEDRFEHPHSLSALYKGLRLLRREGLLPSSKAF